MTAKRYVRVNRYGYECEVCVRRLGKIWNSPAQNAIEADEHARSCPAVAVAMHRDRLSDALEELYADHVESLAAANREAAHLRAHIERLEGAGR